MPLARITIPGGKTQSYRKAISSVYNGFILIQAKNHRESLGDRP